MNWRNHLGCVIFDLTRPARKNDFFALKIKNFRVDTRRFVFLFFFFFQAEDGIRDLTVTGVKTCALPIFRSARIPRGNSASAVLGPMAPMRHSPNARASNPACSSASKNRSTPLALVNRQKS